MFEALTFFRLGELMQQFWAHILFNNAMILKYVATSRQRTLSRLGLRVLQRGESAEVPGDSERDESMSQELRERLRGVLGKLEAECRVLRFKSCFATVGKLRIMLGQTDMTLDRYAEAAGEFEGRLLDELRETSCFALEGRAEELYRVPNQFGEKVSSRFPQAVVDIEEAAKCLALDRATACVFHLMRVLEIGLQELATDLGLAKVDKNWQTLLDNIRGKIKKLPLTTQVEKDYQSDRQEVVAHLQAVKDAWRNDVMHPRASYTEEQALDVWNHSKPLMAKLAEIV